MPERRHHTATLALLAAVFAAVLTMFLRSDGKESVAPFEPDPNPTAEVNQTPVEPRQEEVAPPIAPRVAGERDAQRGNRPLAAPPTAGVLDIRITPTAKAAGEFSAGTIMVEEVFNENARELRPDRKPWAKNKAFAADPYSTPTFVAFEGVPFSPYGYRVRAFVPGFNGSEQIVRVTEDSWNPQVDLTVSPGSTLALRLIDQKYDPYPEQDVVLLPRGRPDGRPVVSAQTDNFGTAIFENVLAGGYGVRIDGEIRGEVAVQAPGAVRDDLNVGVQSTQIVIPRGSTLKVEVFDVGGWALSGVQIRVMMIDTVENRRYEEETDQNGIRTFEHVVPGRYQVDAIARGYQTRSRTITVEEGQDPPPVRFRLARL